MVIDKNCMWNPDFSELATVLEGKKPSRPVLFDLFLNSNLISDIAGIQLTEGDSVGYDIALITVNKILGYDYTLVTASDFNIVRAGRAKEVKSAQTVSINEGGIIADRASFEAYDWPNPDDYSYERLDTLAEHLPEGMKLMIWSASGLLEWVVRLVGYENLCIMLYDDEKLFADIFHEVGKRFLRYFELCSAHPAVGALVSSDDWGFNTQTMLPPNVMREHHFPWQRKFVELAKEHEKYTILHSCGNFNQVVDDIISIGYNARHSYEDNILPVERSYDLFKGKVAVLGGIDIDFMCRNTPKEVYQRAQKLLTQTGCKGYALGTGNSVPDYVPRECYFAMLQAAYDVYNSKDGFFREIETNNKNEC